MTRAILVSCLMLALAGAMCGGSAGSAAPPASSGAQAAQAPAAAPATPGAGQPGSPAPAQASSAPVAAPAAAPAAINPAKVAAQAADSVGGATGTPSAAPASTPAPATATPAALPAGTAAPAVTAPASAAAPSGATPAVGTAESPEAARRKAEIEWALKQDEIKNDGSGQWALSAKASSSYNDAQGTAPFSPGQVTGVPTIESLGNNAMAWSPKTADGGIEWLEVTYAKPVFATAVRIRESLGPGAVIKVEVFDDKGASHVVWSGTDATKGLNYLIVEFPRTAFKTDRVRMTLATNIVSGWQQIDAVQLVGTEQVATSTAAAR